MKEYLKTLTSEFKNKKYAHAYMEEISNMSIAAQIKALREQNNWTQAELAKKSHMKQERISALEDINYDSWTIKTLRKLSKAFDVTIKISFERFSTSMVEAEKISKKDLEVTPRTEDLAAFSNYGFAQNKFIIMTTDPVKTSIQQPMIKQIEQITAANDNVVHWERPAALAHP